MTFTKIVMIILILIACLVIAGCFDLVIAILLKVLVAILGLWGIKEILTELFKL